MEPNHLSRRSFLRAHQFLCNHRLQCTLVQKQFNHCVLQLPVLLFQPSQPTAIAWANLT